METQNEQPTNDQGRGFTRVHLSTWKIILNNFLGGLAWGLGTVLGATLIVGALLFILSKLNTIPIVGSFINEILSEIQQQSLK